MVAGKMQSVSQAGSGFQGLREGNIQMAAKGAQKAKLGLRPRRDLEEGDGENEAPVGAPFPTKSGSCGTRSTGLLHLTLPKCPAHVNE